MKKISSKSGKIVLLVFVFIFIFSIQIFSSVFVSASVEERDIAVEWGDNVFQNLPYTYSGTFYENTDPTDTWDTAKIEFTYIPDSTLNNEYTVTEDFAINETRFAYGETNLTMTDGTFSDFNNIAHDDDNYARFNSTDELGHYPATESFDYNTKEGMYYGTYDFRDELGETGPDIGFVDSATLYDGEVEIVSDWQGHKNILRLQDDITVAEDPLFYHHFTQATSGEHEFWIGTNDVTEDWFLILREDGVGSIIQLRINANKFQFSRAGWHDCGQTAVSNVWYHIKVVWYADNTFDTYFNGVQKQDGEACNLNQVSGVDQFSLRCGGDSTDYLYFDAYGEIEDTTSHGGLGYTVGYNINPYDIEPLLESDFFDYLSVFYGSQVRILSELAGHNNVLETYSNAIATYRPNFYNDISGGETGFVEFWVRQNSGKGYVNLGGNKFQLFISGNILYYHDGATYQTILNPFNPNQWYHIKLVYDCNSGVDSICDVYVDGVLEVDNAEFKLDVSTIDRFYVYHTNVANNYIYFDAIGYSVDSNYDVGDNIHDNYYLGYETFESYNMTNDAEAELEANGWTIEKGSAYNNVSISGGYNSHKKFLNLTDNSNSNIIEATYLFGATQTDGIIEFWYAKSSITTNTESYMYLYESTTICISICFTENDLIYYNGGSWVSLKDNFLVANTWYHIKMVCDDSANTFDFYINEILEGDDLVYRANSIVGLTHIWLFTDSSDLGFSIYLNALSFSWNEPTSYFRGSYNQHCNVEAVVDFSINVPFEHSENFMLQINMSSRHYTNIHTNISWNYYNFTSNSWTEITNYSAITETLREYDDEDIANGIGGLFDSNNNMRFRYYGYNCSVFYLEIDELTVDILFGTQFEYEHTLQLLGTWKYRFKLDIGLGSEYIQDWIYFNVIEQPPNFEGISESRYSTQWVLTSTETTGALTEVYSDDLTSGYWGLTETTNYNFYGDYDIDQDSFVSNRHQNPDERDSNYGTLTSLQMYVGVYDTSWDYYRKLYLSYDTINEVYFDLNTTWNPNSLLYLYAYQVHRDTSNPWIYLYSTSSFDEYTITWNNKPAIIDLIDYQDTVAGQLLFDLGSTSTAGRYLELHQSEASAWCYATFYSRENSGIKPKIYVSYVKNYHDSSGDGYAYLQTDTTETLGLISPQYSNTPLKKGDVLTVDLQTTSDNALLQLYSGSVLQQTLNLLTANTETSRQEVEVIVSEDVSFDQIKITSELDDTQYFKLHDIKAEHWVFEEEEDQKAMYINPYGQNDLIINNLGNVSLKIYENDILRTDTYITISYELNTYIFESPLPETVFVSFYDSNNEYLDFNQFTTYINYTLYEENFINQRLTSREFYVDEDSTIYFNVYDSFDVNIYSASRLAKTFIDITLSVYTLKIKNEALDDSSYILVKGSVSKTGILFPDDIDEYQIASGNYTFSYIKGNDPEESINFDLTQNRLLKINRSQMCFLSYSNQRGEYLDFYNYKTYVNDSLIHENIFYEDIGINASIEIKDRFDISIKNYSFIVSLGDNYIPIILTEYSLKVMNQQQNFNWINITRDPNYYDSPFSWSEWVAPGEILSFHLYPGYYKINLTDNEFGSYAYYSYTLNGDDIILITSDNTISSVLTNIQNVNVTLGNQITNVEINITNQNSQINTSIINVEINLSNINSSLGTMLLSHSLQLTNIENNISNLFIFMDNNFTSLGNNINSSFLDLTTDVYLVNNSIYTAVANVEANLYMINNTINGNLTILLQQNDFLTALYQTTMFSDLLNWSGAGYNVSFIEDQVDAWEFINNYRNMSVMVKLKYQDVIDNLTLAAQASIDQYLPSSGVEYRLWSVADEEYLDEWKPLPDNRTVPFGFFEEEVPVDPNPFFLDFVNFSIFLMVMGGIGLFGLFLYFRMRYQQKRLNPRVKRKKRKIGTGTYDDRGRLV